MPLFIDDFAWPEDMATGPSLATQALPGETVARCADRLLGEATACARCHHPEKDHEKAGETVRSSMKFVAGVKPRDTWIGTNRYCKENPLCSCLDYVSPVVPVEYFH